MSKPKLIELDIVRAWAIVAVVVIHGTSNATLLPVGGFSQGVFYAINRLSHFAVPVFVWISGLVLFYSYYERWDKKAAVTFMNKRFKLILIPYALWSCFYYIYNQLMYHGTVSIDLWQLFKLLLSGNASYHLYYMVIIMQFYCLFPLLMLLIFTFKRLRFLLFPLGLAIQALFYMFQHWISPIPYSATMFPSYTAYFTCGAFIGMHYQSVMELLRRRTGLTVAFFLICAIAFTGMYLLHQYRLAAFPIIWYEVTLLLYSIAAALGLTLIGTYLVREKPRAAALLLNIGTMSFAVYLLHPALLTVWMRLWKPPASIGLYDAYTIGAVLFSLSGSLYIAFLYRTISFNRKIVPSKSI